MAGRRVKMLAATLLVAACGGGETAVVTETTLAGLAPGVIAFRPVLNVCSVVDDDEPPDAGANCSAGLGAGVNQAVLPHLGPGGAIEAYYLVGPVLADGSSLESAHASLAMGHWVVNPIFRAGPDGIDRFNGAAAPCAARDATCPMGQLAIVTGGEVVSAPAVHRADFERDQIQISGDFDEAAATALVDHLLGR
jgi:hypothetical protein